MEWMVSGTSTAFLNTPLQLSSSLPLAIVDRQGRILVMCAGQPSPGSESSPWPLRELNRLIRLTRKYAYIPIHKRVHRRGKYATLHAGISYGGGQKVSFGAFLLSLNFAVLTSGAATTEPPTV